MLWKPRRLSRTFEAKRKKEKGSTTKKQTHNLVILLDAYRPIRIPCHFQPSSDGHNDEICGFIFEGREVEEVEHRDAVDDGSDDSEWEVALVEPDRAWVGFPVRGDGGGNAFPDFVGHDLCGSLGVERSDRESGDVRGCLFG